MGTPSLWADIDHAEECLVSAMFEEAAAAASSTLQILIREVWDEVSSSSPLAQSDPSSSTQRDESGSAEVVSMVEAAGMVLLQALNHMDRPCNLYSELISIFGDLGRVPYSLILTGTCLQCSTGFDTASQTAIEEYLRGWRSAQDDDGPNGAMVKLLLSPASSSSSSMKADGSKGATRAVRLSISNYSQLTQIYAIEVLAKLDKNPAAAHLWIQNASISNEHKQVMLERLQQLGSDAEAARLSRGAKQRRETSPRTVGEPVQRAQDETAGAGSSEQDMSTSAAESSQKANRVQATPNAEEPKSRVVRGSAFWGFPFVRTVLRLVELVMIRLSVTSSSGGIGTRSRLPENKEPILRGAFAAIIVYAILRKREFLRRRLMETANFTKVCLGDLWRLAFTVHLNPLAADMRQQPGRCGLCHPEKRKLGAQVIRQSIGEELKAKEFR